MSVAKRPTKASKMRTCRKKRVEGRGGAQPATEGQAAWHDEWTREPRSTRAPSSLAVSETRHREVEEPGGNQDAGRWTSMARIRTAISGPITSLCCHPRSHLPLDLLPLDLLPLDPGITTSLPHDQLNALPSFFTGMWHVTRSTHKQQPALWLSEPALEEGLHLQQWMMHKAQCIVVGTI